VGNIEEISSSLIPRCVFAILKAAFSTIFPGNGIDEVQDEGERESEIEAHADSEERTEHAEGDTTGRQRDAGAVERPVTRRGSRQSFKRRN